MPPNCKTVIYIPELNHLISKVKCTEYLSSREIEELLSPISSRVLSTREFFQLQVLVGLIRTNDAQSRNLIKNFNSLSYHRYISLGLGSPGKASVKYTVDLIPKTTAHNRRPGANLTAKYLTIHSTGNPTSRAKGERLWLTNPTNERVASFHIVVDDDEAIECIPLDEVAWHAGDGGGPASGNKTSVSIEICESGDRAKALDNAVFVTASTLKKLNIDATRLRRHYDWTQKNCPRILIDNNFRNKDTQTWDWFKDKVKKSF